MAIRAAKHCPLNETGLAKLRREAEKAGITLTSVLETCCANGWAGFQADWYAKRAAAGASPTRTHFNRQVALEESNRAIAEAFIKEMEELDAANREQ